MVKFQTNLWYFWITTTLLVFHMKRCSAEFNSQGIYDYFGFEEMKNDIFFKSGEKMLQYSNTTNEWKCLKELNVIADSSNEFGLWSAQIIDAWGKLPSGILDGNLYDFGSFSECLHVERSGELYETKYCLAEKLLRLEKASNNTINPLGSEPYFTFGICVPAECSVVFLQDYFNQINDTNDTIHLIEGSCQVDENFWNFTTLDWIAAGFLIMILILILMSTAYDLMCVKHKREKSEILLAFSFYSNGKKLLSYEKPKSTGVIRCLDGIRAISAQWILFGHLYRISQRFPHRNRMYIATFTEHYMSTVLLSFVMAVETFLVLSGLLITMNMLKLLEKTKGRINAPKLYMHRYLRITPLLAVATLLTMSLIRFLGDGPLWPREFNKLKEGCDRKWWLSLLYIQNYVDIHKTCINPTWYLSVDMQLFVISPLVVYLLYRFNKKAICALVILVLGCIGCTVAIHLKYNIINMWTSRKAVLAYLPTHLRCSSWIIGTITGYILHKTRNQTINISRTINVIVWIISLVVINAIIFGQYPFNQANPTNTSLENGLYYALSRVGWSISLCYIIFACHHNFGGPINWFLSHPLWQPLSRLSYSTYILQYLILHLTISTSRDSLYFSELTGFLFAIGNYALTVFISIIASLAFEAPVIIIEKSLSASKKRDNFVGGNDK